jgi:hypothetical protein
MMDCCCTDIYRKQASLWADKDGCQQDTFGVSQELLGGLATIVGDLELADKKFYGDESNEDTNVASIITSTAVSLISYVKKSVIA